MKKIPLLIKTFLIFFIFNVIPLPINAQSGQQNAWPMANFLFDYGKTLYERGDFVNAKHELNTLLIIDPNNTLAKHYLKKMSPAAKDLSRISTRARPEAELKEQNRWLRAAVNQFREEIVDKSMRIASLKKEIAEGAKGEAAAKEKQIDQALLDAERFVFRINKYAQEISLLKGELGTRQEGLYKIGQLNRQLDLLRQRLMQAEEGDAQKEARLAEFAGRLQAFMDALQEKEIEAAGLNEKIKAQEGKLSEQNSKIREQSGIIGALNKELASVVGQASLSERIIQEKDRQLGSIRGHLKRLENEGLDKNRQIEQLQALKELELADFKAGAVEVRDLLQAQEMEIAALNRELKLQQGGMDKRLLEKELELAAKYTEIEKLNIRLSETNLQLEQAQKDKLDNELWIEQLHNTVKQLEEASSDQLAKYLKKLNSLEDTLKAKETELAQLSRGFDSRSQELQEQISVKSSETEKLNSKINDCQKKLVILENSFKIKDRELAELKRKLRR